MTWYRDPTTGFYWQLPDPRDLPRPPFDPLENARAALRLMRGGRRAWEALRVDYRRYLREPEPHLMSNEQIDRLEDTDGGS